jgi:mono/diheme cytochrome c family protein
MLTGDIYVSAGDGLLQNYRAVFLLLSLRGFEPGICGHFSMQIHSITHLQNREVLIYKYDTVKCLNEKRRLHMKRAFFGTLLALFLPVISSAQMGGGMMRGGMMGGGMMGPGRGYQRQPLPMNEQGAEIYDSNCRRCHAAGGNLITPNLPLKGAPQLANFNTFLAFIRRPTMPDGSPGPMPAFPPERISDEQARQLYQYVTSVLGSPGQGGPGAGYGMGRGMMGRGYGGYGMGPGYGAPYGSPYRRLSEPLDEQQARQEVENYIKSTRNPNLKVGKTMEKGSQYEVTIETKDGSLVDKILVDKNTGYMHSAY